MNITTKQQLKEFATQQAEQLTPNSLIGLLGELGSGKTTFVKELAKALGIRTTVISPTFVYHQIYDLPNDINGIQRLHHYDLYRLNRLTELDALGIEFDDEHGVHIIEWIDHISQLQDRASKIIKFTLTDENDRSVSVKEAV